MNSLYIKSRGHNAEFPREYSRIFGLSPITKTEIAKRCNISPKRFINITNNTCRMDKTEFKNIKTIYLELKEKYDNYTTNS